MQDQQTKNETAPSRGAVFGYAMALVACLIGAGWQIATRSGVTTSLSPIDLALFRYALPGLILLPLWFRLGLVPKGLPKTTLVLMIVGAGLPFGLLGMSGATYAPVAHMGVMLPGATPLFVAALSTLLIGQKIPSAHRLGLSVIVLGLVLVGAKTLADIGNSEWSGGAWRGDLLFLTAALVWAAYTIAFRTSGLSPWQATAIINGWSMIMVIPTWLIFSPGYLQTAAATDIAIQVLWQGCIAGLLGLWCFMAAIASIGPNRAAALGALVPVITALGGFILLSEALDALTIFGALATMFGVFLCANPFAGTLPKTGQD